MRFVSPFKSKMGTSGFKFDEKLHMILALDTLRKDYSCKMETWKAQTLQQLFVWLAKFAQGMSYLAKEEQLGIVRQLQ